MVAGHTERPPQPGQAGIEIALWLKPEIEAKAKANQSAAGGDKSGKGALSVNLPKALQPIDTRKKMAQAVGIREQVMGRIAQLAENAPQSLKNAISCVNQWSDTSPDMEQR